MWIILKKGPEIFNPSSSELSELDDKISDIKFDISKENPDFSTLTKLEKYRNLKNKVNSLKGQLDYSYTRDFWQLFTSDGINFELHLCRIFWWRNKKI